MLNRDEMARRISRRDGYKIKDIEQVLKTYEDVLVQAIEDGEEVKQGKVFKVGLNYLPEKKNAWDGLHKRRFVRPAKRVPKFKLLSRVDDVEFLESKGDNENRENGVD